LRSMGACAWACPLPVYATNSPRSAWSQSLVSLPFALGTTMILSWCVLPAQPLSVAVFDIRSIYQRMLALTNVTMFAHYWLWLSVGTLLAQRAVKLHY
jgi:hypothetical protein